MIPTARSLRAAAFALPLIAAAPAMAEVTAAAPDGFTLHFEGTVPLSADEAWARLLDIGAWWSPDHTYSGDAGNLSLDAAPGGCWCEIWDGGAVEHGRVLLLRAPVQARFDAPFGPLQGLGVTAILTATLGDPEDAADSGATPVSFDFVVSGSSLSTLEPLAPIVDQVMGEQFSRFVAPS